MKTLLKGIQIFDGTDVICHCGNLLFDETGILLIDSTGTAACEAERCIDGAGKTVTPGLIDSHVHLGCTGMEAASTTRAEIESGALVAAQAKELWRYGITTVRNCGTGTNADIYVRNLIRSGQFSGVRIVACGKTICITGGHGWPMGLQCDTEAEVRKAARLQIREGADMIKLMATGGMGTKGSLPNASQLTQSQMEVAVEEAKTAGLITAAHCTGLEGAQNAIRAGVRCIEHAQLDEETAAMLAQAQAYYCPTIVTRYNILHTTDPAYQWMRAKANPGDLERKKHALQLCRQLQIPVCAGTDAGPSPLTKLGSSLWTELGIYEEYGMPPIEVLRTATRNAAEMMRLTATTGSIQTGLAADLAVFDEDPTQSIANLRHLSMTYQGGVLQWHKE